MFVVCSVRAKVLPPIKLTSQLYIERQTAIIATLKSTTLTDTSMETNVAQPQKLLTQTAPLSTSLVGTHLLLYCSVAETASLGGVSNLIDLAD